MLLWSRLLISSESVGGRGWGSIVLVDEIMELLAWGGSFPAPTAAGGPSVDLGTSPVGVSAG